MEEGKDREKRAAGRGFVKELMSGSLISERIILRNIGYIVFLAFLGALYIANRFHAEDLVRRTTILQTEVTELRAEALSLSAELNFSSRQSEVITLLKQRGLGLEELVEPPFLLVVKKNRR